MGNIKSWTGGANDGNFTTAANWSDGAAPDVSTTLLTIGFGSQNITAGLTPTLAAGCVVNFTPNYSGNVGTSGSALTFGSITTLNYAGTGAFANFGSSGTITNGLFSHSPGCVVELSSGTWTSIVNSLSLLNIDAAAVATTIRNLGKLSVAYNATRITTFVNTGDATLYRGVQTSQLKTNSTTTQYDNGTTTALGVSENSGTCVVETGAVLKKLSSLTEASIEVFPLGMLTTDGTAAQGSPIGTSPGTVTITTLIRWAGAITKLYNTPGVTVAATTVTSYGAQMGGAGSSPAGVYGMSAT